MPRRFASRMRPRCAQGPRRGRRWSRDAPRVVGDGGGAPSARV